MRYVVIILFSFLLLLLLCSCKKQIEVDLPQVVKVYVKPTACPKPAKPELKDTNLSQHPGSRDNLMILKLNNTALINYADQLESSNDCYYVQTEEYQNATNK